VGVCPLPSGKGSPGVNSFICIFEICLHFGEIHDLKGKRKQLHSLKAHLRQRFGAAVTEIDGHDLWQRSTLLCALVGDSGVGARGDELERFVSGRYPDTASFRRQILSLEDIRQL
jgi:uncharacterized protein YlxP (DUF503 family)